MQLLVKQSDLSEHARDTKKAIDNKITTVSIELSVE